MAYKELERLDKLDLSKLTVGDIKGLKDESLKKTLMEAVKRGADVNSHQDHSAHHNHQTGGPFGDNPGG
jgi:hypothetical protein